MKILMLGWELPPYNSGGLGVACYKLSKALAAEGVEIDFAVPYAARHDDIGFMNVIPALPQSPQELQKRGGNAYQSSRWGEKLYVPHSLREQQAQYSVAVQSIAQSANYDVVHAHDWLTYEAAAEVKKVANVPIVAHVHGTEFDRSGEHHGNPLVHEIEAEGLRIADHVMAVSQLTKDVLTREYHIPEAKVSVVHNAIDPQDFEAVSSETSFTYLKLMKAQGYKVVLSTNRFTVQKGMTYFLRAAALAISQEPKLLFLLCGSGEQYEELVQLAAELGISENVILAGFVRGKQWRDAYEIADMFVMSSVSEPFGIAALEAVGHGTATLVSKQSGICEVVRNVLKFNYWDTEKLADYIVAIALEQSLAASLRDNSLNEFKHLTWQNVARKCLSLYREHRLLRQYGVQT